MNAARVKALELTLVAIQFGLPVKDAGGLLEVAELFRAYIEPTTVNPADGDDYERVQPAKWDDHGPGNTLGLGRIPGRY